jgi:hypothetical protein
VLAATSAARFGGGTQVLRNKWSDAQWGDTGAAGVGGGTKVLRNKWSDAQWADVPDDDDEVLSLLALLVLYWCFTGTKVQILTLRAVAQHLSATGRGGPAVEQGEGASWVPRMCRFHLGSMRMLLGSDVVVLDHPSRSLIGALIEP